MNTILKLGPNSVVSQPGDPLVSPDGTVSVNANNDGTATIAKTTGLSATHEPSGATVQFENTAAELAAGVAGGIRFKFTENSTTYDCTAPFWYSSNGFSDYGPISGGPSNWSDEKVEIDTSGVSAFYGDAAFAPWTTISAGGSSTAIIATRPPYDAQIEYLESTGTQYIDTGVVPYPVDTEIEVSVSNLSGTSNNLFYSTASFAVGLADENSGYPSADIMASKSYCHFRFGESSDTSLKVALDGTTGRHIFRLNGSKKEAYVDTVKNDLTSTKSIASWSTNSYTAYIFATRSTKNGSATNISKSGVRLHECRIYQSGALVRDFIPVRVGSGANAVGYLYDRVSGNLFGNAGTGNFTLGADVPPGLARVAKTGSYNDLLDLPRTKRTGAAITVTPKSGWSVYGSPSYWFVGSNLIAFSLNIQKSSAISSGATEDIATLALPSGWAMEAGGPITTQTRKAYAWVAGTTPTIGLMPLDGFAASTIFYLRGFFPVYQT